MDKKKVRVTIAGVPYLISTDEDEAYVENLSEEIDARIASIMDAGSFISPAQAMALSILEYADEAKKAGTEADAMRAQLKEYLADAAQAKSERDMLKRELAKKQKNGKTDI